MKILFPIRFNLMRVGGVSEFNKGLLKNFSAGTTVVDSSLQAGKEYASLADNSFIFKIKRKLITLYDISFLTNYKFSKNNFDLVYLSPSLGRNAIIREIAYAKKCIKYNIPFVSFIHGWNKDYERQIEENGACYHIAKVFNHADCIWVLASEFKNKLISWGIDADKIIVETTMVDDELLDGFDIENKALTETVNILFLSRMIKAKGIFEAVDAFHVLHAQRPDVRLTIAGDGSDLAELKVYVSANNIQNVYFPGFVTGKAKADLLKASDVLFFPTHGEGMPISVLESMAFGIPVITRPVGGIKDFFIDEKMGCLITSNNPEDLAQNINSIISDADNYHKISKYNYEYAHKHFLATEVTRRIESICEIIISNR